MRQVLHKVVLLLIPALFSFHLRSYSQGEVWPAAIVEMHYSPIATDHLRVGINLGQQEIQSLKLYDLSGRVPGMCFKARSGLNEIDISKLTPGVYFLSLETRSVGNFGERFIKQ